MGRNAKASDSQRVCSMPITRLTHHLFGSGVYLLNCLFPLWMIYFSLRCLEIALAYISISLEIEIYLSDGM